MLPLADIRIVALEQFGAGPFGTLHLADLGADVIKIEDPNSGGDIGRYVPPYANGEDSLYFEAHNRNKRSVSLDLGAPAGRAVFEDLVQVSDVVFSNLRGDVPEKLGIRYQDLKHLNAQLVCCSLSGFGSEGPRFTQPGYDYVVQGLAGWMTLSGEPDCPPEKTGLSLVDYSAGLVAALTILAGVHTARRDGVGMDCDLSLFDTAMSLLTYQAAWHLTEGYTPQRTPRSAHPSLTPFQVFQASDGWLVIGVAKEKFWDRLLLALNRDDLFTDHRFADFGSRLTHRSELEATLETTLATRPVDDWIARLEAHGVPCARVNTVPEAFADEQSAARRLVIETQHPHLGPIRQVATASRVGAGRSTHERAPFRGEHTAAVLGELLGHTGSTISDLARRGAFGPLPDPSAQAAEVTATGAAVRGNQ